VLIGTRSAVRHGWRTPTASAAEQEYTLPTGIETFLAAYHPKFICLPCLSTLTQRDPDDVVATVVRMLREWQLESEVAECRNCHRTDMVVRRR
jgi:hypothetical protein